MWLRRRELLRLGSLSILSGAWTRSAAETSTIPPPAEAPARACIYLLLQGGPSQLDLWDPKPSAPAEVRSPFRPLATRVPGLEFTEMLPRTALVAQHLSVVRSLEHTFNNHIAGTYITLTGSGDQPNQDREAHGDDAPGPGAIINYLQQAPGSMPASVSLPTWLSIPGPSNRMPGQYAGYLGSVHDPFLIAGEPQDADFKPLSLALPDDISPHRLSGRWELGRQLDAAARRLEAQSTSREDRLRESAFNMLVDRRLRDALDLSREPSNVRERYGMTKIGQSLLLSRRLIEAGVRWVSYNAFNQQWDTHWNIAANYPQLVPPMDQAYSALIEDLAERGLLSTTLVVNAGEFGRTPQLNKDGGRDHWPHAYSVVLAGGGVRGGMWLGQTDAHAAYVTRRPIAPADLLATIWNRLGIDPRTEMRDRLGRQRPLSVGTVVRELLA